MSRWMEDLCALYERRDEVAGEVVDGLLFSLLRKIRETEDKDKYVEFYDSLIEP